MSNSGANENVFDILKNAHCEFLVAKPKLTCNCQNPCQRDDFGWTVSTATWPVVENQLAFYDQYIRPYPGIYGNEFDAYASVTENSNNLTIAQHLYDIAGIGGIGLIGKNFLLLNVLFEKRDVMFSQEIPTVSPYEVFANFGEILELWMGMSAMVAAEFIELIFGLIAVCIRGGGDEEEPTPSLAERKIDDGNISVERNKGLADIETSFHEIDETDYV